MCPTPGAVTESGSCYWLGCKRGEAQAVSELFRLSAFERFFLFSFFFLLFFFPFSVFGFRFSFFFFLFFLVFSFQFLVFIFPFFLFHFFIFSVSGFSAPTSLSSAALPQPLLSPLPASAPPPALCPPTSPGHTVLW